jgi:hypothetical protein
MIKRRSTTERRHLSEETAMSFQEWSDCGYTVIKGEKSEIRDALGVPQFTKEQVTKKKPSRYQW